MNTRFAEIVAIFDRAKELYWLCQYIIEYRPNDPMRESATAALDALVKAITESVRNHIDGRLKSDTALELDITLFVNNLNAKLDAIESVPCSEHRTIKAVCDSILADALDIDTPFYRTGGYGKSWDDVPLPKCIAAAMSDYAHALSQYVPGLVGTEANTLTLHDGYAAITYYDLSNLTLVFRDEDKARAFAEENPVDPSDYMRFYHGNWFGL